MESVLRAAGCSVRNAVGADERVFTNEKAVERLRSGCEKIQIGGRAVGDPVRDARVFCSGSGTSPQPKRKPRIATPIPKGYSKNDLKLQKELREFICATDLSPADVPTTTVLLRHGRQDLANAVRRRGHKFVSKLLGHLSPTEGNAENRGDTIGPARPRLLVSEVGFVRGTAGGLLLLEPDELESANVVGDTNGGVFVRETSHGNLWQDFSNAVASSATGRGELVKEALEGYPVVVPEVVIDNEDVKLAWNVKQEAAEDLVQTQDASADDESRGKIREHTGGTHENSEKSHLELLQKEAIYDSNDRKEDGGHIVEEKSARQDPAVANPESTADIATEKAAMLWAKLQSYNDVRSEDFGLTEKLSNIYALSNEVGSQQKQEAERTALREIETQHTQRRKSQKDLINIKNTLKLKDLEFAEVYHELQEAKAQLALACAKSQAELSHAKQLALEKDHQLQVAIEALAQLKQVHVEWWGKAVHVELAGSFNGWQNYVLLEPDPTSEIPNSDGSRGSMMWGTHLCLYPGVYEIKFIVDGIWTVDHRREVVMGSFDQNNILRVE